MKKPEVHFRSEHESGNIFWIIGAVQLKLHEQQRITDYNTMRDRVLKAGSYVKALEIINEYVTLVDDDRRYRF